VNLPALREELVLQDGPRLHDGQPSWTLHDPTRNRFFRLDWLTFEIFKRWSLGEPALIARTISEQTPLEPTADDVMAVITFAGSNQLLKIGGADMSAGLAESLRRMHPSWWQWLIHNYLFFRVPLFRPERLLGWLNQRLAFVFRPAFWKITGAASALGLALVWRQWDVFKATFVDFASLHGVLGYLVVLVGIKVIHECGHGLVATHFGCRVPSMGVAFLVMTPVAYTNTNEAWNLKERTPRILIGAAGMLAELSLAAWATLGWGILPDGYLRSVAFLVATTTWVKSLIVNTSPLMRFDGYYLLSDYLDLPNLHSRAFALTRWRLREWLFGLGEAPPEYFKRSLRNGLIALALFIWAYRLVIFTGIAIFVYHFFFKALGIVLFAVEIAWFIALPIAAEIKEWFTKRKMIKRSPRLFWISGFAATLTVLAVLPLPQRVHLVGQFSSAREFNVITPEAARLVALSIQDGANVEAGEPLLRLESPALMYRLSKAKAQEESLSGELAAASANMATRSRASLIEAQLATTKAARRDADAAIQHLAPVAPFAGRVRMVDPDLRVGDELSRNESIATVVGEDRWQVIAYLEEKSAHLVKEGAGAKIYFEGLADRPVALRVVSVDRDASRQIVHPMLTADAGGDLRASILDGELIPEQAVYRVLLEATQVSPELAKQVRRGTVVISAGSEAPVIRWSQNALSLLWRELGF
jgi:putative peptide zinc metalloprotease protein